MYENKLSLYYDILYSQKDYKSECELIKKYTTKTNLLDVGCGTLSHSIILSDYFTSITGIDLSEPMIDVARKKIENKNIKNIDLLSKELDEVNYDNNYENVISMFNVVNHILSFNELEKFFRQIHKFLKPNGQFVFDCWNGVACTIEKPLHFSTKKVNQDHYTITQETTTTTDLFNSLSTMYSTVKVYDDISQIDEFEYIIKQKL